MNRDKIQDYIKRLEKFLEIDGTISDNLDFDIIEDVEKLMQTLSKDVNQQFQQESNKLVVKIKKTHENAVIPTYARPGDAAMDLTAVEITTNSSYQVVYDCGIALEIPRGFVGIVYPRSSIRNMELSLANSVGIIDSGYRGNLQATFNKLNGFDSLKYNIGDRIAQIMIVPYPQIEFLEVENLSETERGTGGHGSTNF